MPQKEIKWSFKLDRVDFDGQRSTQPTSMVNINSIYESAELNATETIKMCQENVQKIIDFLLLLNFLPIILAVWLMIISLLNGLKNKFQIGVYMGFNLAHGIAILLPNKTCQLRKLLFLKGQRLFVMGLFCLEWIQKFISNIGQNIITINETISVGLYLNVRIESLQSSFLIDTGASRSLVSRKLYDRLSKKVTLSKNKLPKLQLADGTSLETYGVITVPLLVGPVAVKQDLIVADISDVGILGLDFLEEHQCSLDMKSSELEVAGIRIACGKGSPIVEVGRVKCAISVTVPPATEKLIWASVENPPSGDEYLVEPSEGFEESSSLKVAASLHCPGQDMIRVRVMNPLSEVIQVHEGQTLGFAFEVVELQRVIQECRDEQKKSAVRTVGVGASAEIDGPINLQDAELPEHLVELYESICQNVDDTDELLTIRKLLIKFQDGFSKGKFDLGQTSVVEHAIDTGSSHPIKQRPRRTPVAFWGEEEKEVKAMLEQGIIEPSNSPWSSPVCLVQKKDGSTRFCVDYRLLNDCSVKDSYPLPRISDCLDSLVGARYFSTMDLASGYWQIRVKEEDRPKTAFVTKAGLYQFLVMPFGLANAPSTFERCMESILRAEQWATCLIYLDDIIVFARSPSEMTERLNHVLNKLVHAGLKLKPSKCNFYARQVHFLGHVVSAEGVVTDPNKISSVVDWPTPTSVTDIRSFLGLCSYYRKFIKDFAKIADPLTRLTQKDVPFKWDSKAQEAMDALKLCLVNAPILSYPDPSADFVLDCDASDIGIGGVLSQVIDGKEQVVCYGSKSLSKPERRYCVTRRELLAVVYFVKHYRQYLLGKKFTVRSDHQPLKWLFKLKEPTGQVARWLELLQSYDFVIDYRAGKQHGNADGMSRVPCHPTSCTCHFDQDDLPCGPCSKCARRSTSDTLRVSRVVTRHQSNFVDSDPEPWTGKHSAQELREIQLQDKHIAPVLLWKEELPERPCSSRLLDSDPETRYLWLSWDSLSVRNGVLYRKTESDSCNTHWQLVVPYSLRDEVLNLCHNCLSSGHLGEKKTLARLLQFATWYKVRDSVHLWVQRCQICQASKHSHQPNRPPLGTITVGAPLDKVATDLIGPFPTTKQGNKHILVVQDYFTKWVEFYPVPDTQAETCARIILNEFISRYGVPLSIHSDQGSNYESELFQKFCEILDIKKTRTSPRHPSGNGMVERVNSTLLAMIRSYMKGHQNDWDLHLGSLAGAYRSSVHDSTGFTPNLLMLGRETTQPVHLIFGDPNLSSQEHPADFVHQTQNNLRQFHDIARNNLKRAANYRKTNHDLRIALRTFSKGDLVWFRNERRSKGRCPKLQSIWFGPCVVLQKLNDLNYRIQLNGSGSSKVVHIEKLKQFHGKETGKRWIKTLQKQLN